MPFASVHGPCMAEISIEVVYALPDRQALLKLQLPQGTTAREAVQRSGLEDEFPGLELSTMPLGLFGKRLPSPETHVLEPGDRIELYRPLRADPKEVRKQRAARAQLRGGRDD